MGEGKKRGQIGKKAAMFFFPFFPQWGAWYQANYKLSSPSTLCHTQEAPEGLEIVAFVFTKSVNSNFRAF